MAPPIDRPAVPVALHSIKGAGSGALPPLPLTLRRKVLKAFADLGGPGSKEAEAAPEARRGAARAERKGPPTRISPSDAAGAAQATATLVSSIEEPRSAEPVDKWPDTTKPEPSVETEEAVKAVTAPAIQDIAAKVVAEDRPQATLRSEEA